METKSFNVPNKEFINYLYENWFAAQVWLSIALAASIPVIERLPCRNYHDTKTMRHLQDLIGGQKQAYFFIENPCR